MGIEGKTKRLMPGDQTGTLILETKNELTGGDAAKKATIAGIAAHKTLQTANVFHLLQQQGIPVAFIEQFLDANPVANDLGKILTRALPENLYLFSGSVDVSRPFEGWATGLPHTLIGLGDSPDLLFYQKYSLKH